MSLTHYLDCPPAEAADIAAEMDDRELREVIDARRHGTRYDVAGHLISIVLRSDLRQHEESDVAAWCAAVTRAQERWDRLKTELLADASPRPGPQRASLGRPTAGVIRPV